MWKMEKLVISYSITGIRSFKMKPGAKYSVSLYEMHTSEKF